MSDLGEFELIARLVESVESARRERSASWGPAGARRRAATTPRSRCRAGATATSVDAIVEGVHFRRRTAPLASVGRKAIAIALSDLAAMGAAPGEAYVQLGVPDDLDEAGCAELAGGLAAAAAEHSTSRFSAATSPGLRRSPWRSPWSATPTRPTSSCSGPALARATLLAVTGELGGAAAGLLLLERPELAEGLPDGVAERLRRRQLEPQSPARGRAGAGRRPERRR